MIIFLATLFFFWSIITWGQIYGDKATGNGIAFVGLLSAFLFVMHRGGYI